MYKGMKRKWTAAVTSCLMLSLAAVCGGAASAEEVPGEFSFDLNACVFDYGESINQVIIDMGDLEIDPSSLDDGTFTVLATAVNPYDLGEDDSEIVYEDVERTITDVTVDEDGCIVIDLYCEYGGEGEGTLNYVTAARNLSTEISYDVIQNEDFSCGDGTVIAADSTEYVQNEIIDEEVEQFEPGTSNGINYELYTPENADDGELHPLIVWFHGNGEGGYEDIQNNTSQLRANRGALGFTEESAQEIFGGAYVLAPQTPDTWYYNYTNDYISKMTAMIEEITETYNVDPNRIYVYGCSAGGYMTVRMAIENPDLFAAVVPICPAIDVAEDRGGVATTDEEILSLDGQNIWLVQSKNDGTVMEADCAGRMAELLENAIYTPYETVNVDGVEYPGHWSWTYVARNMPVYDDLTIFEWTAAQTLD